MRTVPSWAVYGLIVIAAAPIALAEVVAFGPRTYTLSTGKPVPVTDAVTIEWDDACEAESAFVLVADNDRVSSATVRVNGTAVITERDVNPARRRIEVPLTLQAANTVTVEIKGGAMGASLTLSILRTIEEPVAPATTYQLSAGRSVFRSSYAVDDAGSGFALVIRNGDEGGEHRVTAATVSLNGTTVVAQESWDRHAPAMLRVPVSLQHQNELVIDARGGSGARLTVDLRRILPDDWCKPRITITAPEPDSVIPSAAIAVRGTVTGTKDVAVTVNGLIAEIDLSRAGSASDPFVWFVDIPAMDGELELIATATTRTGAKATDQRVVQFQASPRAIDLSASPRSGVAPLEVVVHVSARQASDVERYEIDFDGNGVPELSVADLPSIISHTYETPAEYSVIVRTVMSDGTTETAATSVLAHSWITMDGLLRASWSRIASALSRQDVDSALRDFSLPAQQKYGSTLRTIRPSLSAYIQSIVSIDPVWIRGNAARYLLRRVQNGRTFGYHVYFTRGSDGVWRLTQF